MSTLTVRTDPTVGGPSVLVDNRLAYVFFAVAYVFGHGANEFARGGISLGPTWKPWVVLGLAFAAGTVASTVAALRAQKTLRGADLVTARMLGMAWITGFSGLFLLITGLSLSTGSPDLQLVLWPTGSALVVGLISIAEGAVRRDRLHYALGTLLTLLGGAALLLTPVATLAVMAIVGGGAYIAAALGAHRRLQLSSSAL